MEADGNAAGSFGVYAVDVYAVEIQAPDGGVILPHEDAVLLAVGDIQLAVLVVGVLVKIAQSHAHGVALEVEGAAVHPSDTDGILFRAAGFQAAIEIGGCQGGILSQSDGLALATLQNQGPVGGAFLATSGDGAVAGQKQLSVGFQPEHIHLAGGRNVHVCAGQSRT